MNLILPPAVQAALERLSRSGYRAYAVGGCVRDTLLGRVPNDWDITTSARPEQTAAVFSDCRTVETGIRHGTLTVILDGMPLEITTFRNDGEYADNRHPVSVTFSSTVEEDLARRDFTVNALAYHPEEGLVDLFCGQEDLQRRVIRCVGEPARRFEEDGLRILRALRFSSVLDFAIDPTTAKAVHSHRALLHNIAAERIREEFCKLICGKGAVRILREFSDVIGIFLPELERAVGFPQRCRYHCYDVFEHSLHALEEAPPDLVTRLAVLLHDVGKPLCLTEDEQGAHFKGHGEIGTELTHRILTRLRFDNSTVDRVCRLVKYHDTPFSAEPRSVKRLMQRLSDEDIDRLMQVQRCDRLAHAPEYRDLSETLVAIPRTVRELRASDACLSLKTMQLRGDDLIALGVRPGKQIGSILAALLERVLDGELPNEHDALLTAAKQLIE